LSFRYFLILLVVPSYFYSLFINFSFFPSLTLHITLSHSRSLSVLEPVCVFDIIFWINFWSSLTVSFDHLRKVSSWALTSRWVQRCKSLCVGRKINIPFNYIEVGAKSLTFWAWNKIGQ
jgi:hypothetical protein